MPSPMSRARDVLEPVHSAASGTWDLSARARMPRFGALKLATGLFNALQERLAGIITSIASRSVAMSQAAPELARLAVELDQGARVQAEKAAHIAESVAEISQQTSVIAQSTSRAVDYAGQVAQATVELQETTRSIGQAMNLIRKVASQTRLLSINAAVEAARAGEHGAGFAVVAGEVQSLADQSMEAANKVEDFLSSIGVGVEQLAAAVGGENSEGGLHGLLRDISHSAVSQDADVEAVSADIEEIAASASQQADAVGHIRHLGEQARDHADNLLTSVGVFRLDAHGRALKIVETLAAAPDICSMNRSSQESAMRRAVGRGEVFELLYITNSAGRQTTSNIAPAGSPQPVDPSAYGRNWSDRPWYLGVAETGGSFTSDIYRSTATGDFCFTVSTPLIGSDGKIVGVLAADVQFAKMLDVPGGPKALLEA